jgi:hypothetical protein
MAFATEIWPITINIDSYKSGNKPKLDLKDTKGKGIRTTMITGTTIEELHDKMKDFFTQVEKQNVTIVNIRTCKLGIRPDRKIDRKTVYYVSRIHYFDERTEDDEAD